MNINGHISLFVEKRKDKTFFVGSICKKNEDETRVNKSIDIYFSKDAVARESLAKLEEGFCYTLDVAEGFISVDVWQTKEGEKRTKFVLQILKCSLLKKTEIKNKVSNDKQKDLPF